MLKDLFTRYPATYLALPVLGEFLDGFTDWELKQGYRESTLREQLRGLRKVDLYFRSQGLQRPSDITSSALEACWTALHCRDSVGGAVRSLQRYLEGSGALAPSAARPSTRTESIVAAYRDYLRDVRGFTKESLRSHLATTSQFLDRIGYEHSPSRISAIAAHDIEEFLRASSARRGRRSLQIVASNLRGFLRFLAVIGEIQPGLEALVDTPRVYHYEQLPRVLAWGTVRALLASIDRTTAIGARDYTMLFLIAAYGLRVSEIADLTLDDIGWREGCLRVSQRKTGRPVILPLTDLVGHVLLRYLRHHRPHSRRRELFLRTTAPAGRLTPRAVSASFNKWSKRSGLGIPFHGAHCLRHSYAIHLLRRGTSMKAIGDLLGHRTAAATSMYLRCAIEDLRGVALAVPKEKRRGSGQEVRP